MASLIDFATADLRSAFDFAIMIEEDAQLRYEQLAQLLVNDPGGAGDVFRMMAVCESRHRSELVARRDVLFRQDARRIEISVMDGEGVERPDVVDDDLPRTARGALEAALAAERRAHDFYRDAIPNVRDAAVRAFFEEMRAEEVEHAALIAGKIAELGAPAAVGEDRAAPRLHREPARPPETYPDRALLEEAIPHFDAATRAVAVGVVVEGKAPREVAEALGVSHRTVSRKLTRFLAYARQHLAVALATATLGGCAGHIPAPDALVSGPPSGSRAAPRLVHEPAARTEARWPHAAPPAPDADAEETVRVVRKVHAQVAARMRRHPPSVHAEVARAVLHEASLTQMDPLLVLAVIHVESSFNPHAVSSVGAVGLMQIMEPTMRREVERSKLASTDRRDPVANVRAGVRYLRRLVDAFGGRVDVALMAYNAGPNRIRGFLRQGGIPARFHGYPRKVNTEVDRLRSTLGAEPIGGSLAKTRMDGAGDQVG